MSTTERTTEISAEPGTQNIVMHRDFATTPEQLFRAHTDPDLIRQWMGPDRLTVEIDVWEARDGGRWRFVHREEGGGTYAFRGVFHGEPTVDGIRQTWEFEGWPGVVSFETLTFEDLGDGRTRLHATSTYPSVEARDAMIDSGMETGVNDGYAKLDAILEGGLS